MIDETKPWTFIPSPGEDKTLPAYQRTDIKENYNPYDLQDVNRIRIACNKSPIDSLNGYCMSSGCSCRPEHKSICGLFKSYEADGIKKDFINQIFGI